MLQSPNTITHIRNENTPNTPIIETQEGLTIPPDPVQAHHAVGPTGDTEMASSCRSRKRKRDPQVS